MNAVDVKGIATQAGLNFTDAQLEQIATRVKNVDYFNPAEILINSTTKMTPKAFINLIFDNRPKSEGKIEEGYITVPKLSDIPNYKQGKFIPCAVPKISIKHPNCQAESLARYISMAESLGLMPYVLAYFDHMVLISQIKPHFLKNIQAHEFDYYFNQSKMLWERPNDWDNPAKMLDVNFNSMRQAG